MKIKATDEQVQKMCALATQASQPVGMGFLHYDGGTLFGPSDFLIPPRRVVYLDYVQGRMVKLTMREVEPGIWEASDPISADYESWIRAYPSYAELAAAAEAEVVS